MIWFKKKRDDVMPTPAGHNLQYPIVAAIDILMRNGCVLQDCLPELEQTGLQRESISLIYNLTLEACARLVLEATLSADQIPDHYLFVDQHGSEQTARFANSDIYLTAKSIIGNYGSAAEKIGESSASVQAMRRCIDILGGETKENLARILISPPVFPAFGQAGATFSITSGSGGASRALKRRAEHEKKYFKGKGLDVGGGGDSIDRFGAELGFDSCRNWDLADGDAQYLATIADGTFDFLHSSHCLEHMVDPYAALANWIRVVRDDGYLVIVLPDEELYEDLCWPSLRNWDHKWSFTIDKGAPRLPKSVNVVDLLRQFCTQLEIIKIERIEAGYRADLKGIDQTLHGSAECAIEIILRKRTSQVEALPRAVGIPLSE